ncbi:MAG: putative sugar O-methyltransferase [Thermodesulfobacteriota bacterium]|nr:putative sugar O-methyltransferase [Thermodesulfobacteriota bacterium]
MITDQPSKEKYSTVNLCAWQIPLLHGDIDLFVNFISFQEMEPDIVENYCSNVRCLNPKYILIRNIKEGKKTQGKDCSVGVVEPILGEKYDTFFPDHELIDKNTNVFGFLTEDGFHSELRLYKRFNF